MSDSVRPHRQQPTRLLRPWDSPGENTGVSCHFLLQCMELLKNLKRDTGRPGVLPAHAFISRLLAKRTRAGALGDQGSPSEVRASSSSSWEQGPPFASKPCSGCCVTLRAPPPLLGFTAGPFISEHRVRAGPQQLQEGAERTQLRQCQGSETSTPGPRPQICSEHAKSRGNGSALQHPHLPSHCDFKIKKRKKPFREHFGVTQNTKMSSLKSRCREGNCCIFRIVDISFNNLKVVSSNSIFKAFLFLRILFPPHLWYHPP